MSANMSLQHIEKRQRRKCQRRRQRSPEMQAWAAGEEAEMRMPSAGEAPEAAGGSAHLPMFALLRLCLYFSSRYFVCSWRV
jgi:hypothetical protein